MKVLIFTLEFPPMVGGAGTYSYELSVGLNQLGHEITILTSDRDKNAQNINSIDKKLGDLGITIKRKKWVGRIWYFYWSPILKNEIRNSNYDVIVFANQGSIIIGSKVKNLDIPYMCTLHGGERYTFLSDRNSIKNILFFSKRHIHHFLQKSLKVICVSQDLFNDVSLRFSSLPLRVIPLGISKTFDREREYSFEQSIIVSTSRLVKEKGHDVLLDVCKELTREGFNFKLIIIGNGAEMENLSRITKLEKLEGIVTFLGEKSREELADLYPKMDLFILLTRFKETFGLVFLEAMLTGLPVIGSDLGAIPEIINHGENGFLVNPRDVKSISNYIKKALNNREKLGKAAKKTALNYTNLIMAEKHIENLDN